MKKRGRALLAGVLALGLALPLAVPAVAAEAGRSGDIYSSYQAVLDEYVAAQNSDFDFSVVEQLDINQQLALMSGGGTKLSFALVDMAGDGEPELFIGTHSEGPGDYTPGATNYYMYDAFGYANGRVQRLFGDGVWLGTKWLRISIMKDNILENVSSYSAFEGGVLYYEIPAHSATATLKQYVEHDYRTSEEYPFFYEGANDPNVKWPISGARYEAVQRLYQYRYDIPWYPITDSARLKSLLDGYRIPVMLNGEALAMDQSPIIQNGRTLVPLRAIFEGLGASVDWDGTTRTVTSTLDGTTVRLSVGDNTLYKNDAPVALDVPAQIIGGRTMVPVRAISEAFGAQVKWDGATRTVYVTQ
ncbi:MAG: copper amine oxidase N-terminal domain-containing protein [Peptococcaceae bacterium]|nr:copper amine oxidase N-terminal domain-containing protein [Peptococcaceae bacterium]